MAAMITSWSVAGGGSSAGACDGAKYGQDARAVKSSHRSKCKKLKQLVCLHQAATRPPPSSCMKMAASRPPVAIPLIVAIITAVLSPHPTRLNSNRGALGVHASLIRMYHRNLNGGGDELAALGQPTVNQTQETHHARAVSSNSRMATIDLSSPMKRIIDLIGQHAPVIVLDSSEEHSQSADDPPPPAQQTSEASTSPKVASTNQPELSQASILIGDYSDQRLQPQQQQQQQQQHWAILDTAQIIQQQQQQSQQQLQQQQPLATQQQRLIQSSVPNEQYFTFTPFGLAPTSNPFTAQQQQQQQAYVTYPQQQALNPFALDQAQLTQQSSQNYLQQQQQQQETGPIQPVFLSSYVAELPGPPIGQMPSQFQVQQAQQPPPQQQQQPNSIQQIQQAQQEQANADSKPDANEPTDQENENSPNEDANSSSSSSSGQPAAAEGGDDEPATTNDEAESTKRHSQASDEGEPSSGSMSYENKYDSDKEPAGRPRKSSGDQQVGGLVNVGLNDDCLQCICRASSGCDHLLRCITIGAEEKYCGPFQLTEEYWQKAGSPGDAQNNFSSFEECANDADCAVETVTNYMKKYYKDCDGDENVTCMDYARLHRLKPQECSQTSRLLSKDHEGYWKKFQRCAEGYNRTRDGEDEDIR